MKIKKQVSLTIIIIMFAGLMTLSQAQNQFEVEFIEVERANLWQTSLVDWDGDHDIDILAATESCVLLFEHINTYPLELDSSSLLEGLNTLQPFISAGVCKDTAA